MIDPDEYIQRKYGLAVNGSSPMPVDIPNVGRRDLAKLFHELGFKLGVEIGVEAGHYTEVLGQELPDATIYAVDAWQAYRGYRDHVTQSKLDTFYRRAQGRAEQFNGRVKLIRKFSLDAAEDFAKRSVDFVYIDANHDFRHVAEDIDTWSDKVRVGGIVSGHDYREYTNQCFNHVVTVVDGWTYSYRIRPWYVFGRKDIVEGEIRDRSRSWLWVKR